MGRPDPVKTGTGFLREGWLRVLYSIRTACTFPRQEGAAALLNKDGVWLHRYEAAGFFLFKKNRVHDAVLGRPGEDPGLSELGLDDGPPGEDVSPHVVRVCPVLHHRLDLRLPRLAGGGHGDIRELGPQGPDLVIPAPRPDEPAPALPEGRVGGSPPDLEPLLPPGDAVPLAALPRIDLPCQRMSITLRDP